MDYFDENDQRWISIETKIAEIDGLISLQLNEILHHEDFQRLEASWRGLHYLVNEARPNQNLKIKVLQATKKELLKDFERSLEYFDSFLYYKIYDEIYDTFGAEPYGMLIGDYEFGNSPQDLALLENISMLATSAHAPFITAVSPEMFGLDNFTQMSELRELSTIFSAAEYTRWRSFRASPDSKQVGLILPHILMRKPYAPKQVGSFNFQENARAENLVWGNAAYAFGACVAKAYRESGWCGMICGPDGDGLIEGLSASGSDWEKIPVDTLVYAERETELADLGFIPVVYYQSRDEASFYSSQSCRKPPLYDSEPANVFARRDSQLPYNFAMSRFAHYLKALVRDRSRPFADPRECQRALMNWLGKYYSHIAEAENDLRYRYPLCEYLVNVDEIPREPGELKAIAFLRMAYLLDDTIISLRMQIRLPKNQGSPTATGKF